MSNEAFAKIGAHRYYKQQGVDPTWIYITFAIYVAMLVGASSVIYGCILLKRTDNENRHAGSAITRLIGGTIAVNILFVLHQVESFIGLNMLQ